MYARVLAVLTMAGLVIFGAVTVQAAEATATLLEEPAIADAIAQAMQAGNYAEARQQIDQRIEAGDANADYLWYLKGRSLHYEGKYDEAVDRESAEEVLLAKASDAAATAQEVEEKGEEEVRKQSRKSTSLWGIDIGKAGKSALKAATGSLAAVAVAKVLGKKSSADPVRTGANAFVRNIIGGLMR